MTMAKIFFLAGAAGFIAISAFAQDASAPVARAQADAAELLQDAPSLIPGARGEPDDDSFVDPNDLAREPLGNFHPVSPGIFRSALPSPAGYLKLKEMGFKTILNLQANDADEIKKAEPEIRVAHVAMSGFKKPTFDQMDRALDEIAAAEKPVLVHCTRGMDRTGFVIASWRVYVEKKPIPAAAEEARSYGCCFAPFGDLNRFLTDYGVHRRALPPAKAASSPLR
jgi:hypothetical protein